MYETYKKYIKPEHYLDPYGIHGIPHVHRVLCLADKISANFKLTERERKVLALACVYHDIGRVHDDEDMMHGAASVRKLLALGLLSAHNCKEEDRFLIEKLIIAHCVDDKLFYGTEKERFLYNILKDADGLDRVRLGDLDTRYLRFEESKALVDFALDLFVASLRA